MKKLSPNPNLSAFLRAPAAAPHPSGALASPASVTGARSPAPVGRGRRLPSPRRRRWPSKRAAAHTPRRRSPSKRATAALPSTRCRRLRLRVSPSHTATCPRSEHRPGARRLHAVLTAANSRVVLGCGLMTLDYLATVDAYPRPDDRIRTRELQISGGGNTGNALTAAARLDLNTRVISKVANDETGRAALAELKVIVTSSHSFPEAGSPSPWISVAGGGEWRRDPEHGVPDSRREGSGPKALRRNWEGKGSSESKTNKAERKSDNKIPMMKKTKKLTRGMKILFGHASPEMVHKRFY
ncbi:hypothetical protein U9M48_027866 [Paspalum notatum var. saurae]|uniref:Carbohydrate kinase PfkB domain-containing protein n=1 Tax=Paspalum notatum var. saurae TaxID=547442 RepID=A0AAQ3X0G6_PASNO